MQIEHTSFRPNYLPYLVNDIAAAKAYLDRQNDQRDCNTSNLIVLGVGEGATLGSIWLANECRRRKDKNREPVGLPILGDQESKSVAAGVWISISSTLGGNRLPGPTPVSKLVTEAGKTNTIPMAFIFGEGDTNGAQFSKSLYTSIKGTGKGKGFEWTGTREIKTKLAGQGLLDLSGTQEWILKTYLPGMLEARGNKERVTRKVEESRFYYVTNTNPPRILKINKQSGEDVPPVDVRWILGLP